MKIQIGEYAAKHVGSCWEVGKVKPRIIKGKLTEEIIDAQYTAHRIDACRLLIVRATQESEIAASLLSALVSAALVRHTAKGEDMDQIALSFQAHSETSRAAAKTPKRTQAHPERQDGESVVRDGARDSGALQKRGRR